VYKVRVDPGFYMPRVVKRATSRAVAHAALQVGAAGGPLQSLGTSLEVFQENRSRDLKIERSFKRIDSEI